jgi:hypothetical protein
MMQHIFRRTPTSLEGLPGLPAEITIGSGAEVPLRGKVVDVRDGRVVLDVGRAGDAKLLATAMTARLTVHAPGVQFEAMTAPAGMARGSVVELRIGPDVEVRPRIA